MSAAPSPDRRGAVLAMAAAIVVAGTAFTLIKLVLRDLSPLSLAAGRVVFSAVTFTAVVLHRPGRRRPIAAADRWLVLGCGLGGSAGFHLLYAWGQQRVSVAVGAVVLACMPVLVAASEVVFLRHRLRGRQVAGLALSLGGVAVMSWRPGAAATSVTGLLAVAAATVVWAGVTVATRSLADRYDPWWLNTPGTVVGAALMLVLVSGRSSEFARLSPVGWLELVWLGAAGSAFTYAALTRAMRDFTATTTATLTTLVTPLSVAVAWLGLGETPGVATALGVLAVLAGVVLSTRPGRSTLEAAVGSVTPAGRDAPETYDGVPHGSLGS